MTAAPPTKNSQLLNWIKDIEALCQPDRVVWIDGSDAEKKRLEEEAVASGDMLRLDPVKLPGCFYHRSNPNDVARAEGLTFICTSDKEEAGPTNNWMEPQKAYAKAREIFKGSMKGRAMYVIPFSMGEVGSHFSKIGVQVTDSVYVVLNMRIMTRTGNSVLEYLGADGTFTKCLHGKADLNPERRLILHFPEDNAIWSVGSGYGGNALLGKKCLSLRIASTLARKEGWMAEHMLILGIDRPGKETKFIVAAFPSACGKTNLAMMVPPEEFRKKGYRVWTVGDDIAWLRADPNGVLRAVNPEAGFFGVVPGTNSRSNPNAVATIRKNTIYTNVALKKDNTVWWEDSDDPAPSEALDWKGRPWSPGLKDENGKPVRAAHPNSRFTAPFEQCPSAYDGPLKSQGVPISAIIFGGRRARLAPLAYEARDWNHGVFMAATVASERTAAQEGKVGEVRFDPMSMLPFCGYNMADYFAHWIGFGKKLRPQPKIFHVNWFRTDANGKFLWPGFGENLRVLDWVLNRCEGTVNAENSPIGSLPKKEDIDFNGLSLTEQDQARLFAIDKDEWKDEQKLRKQFFDPFGARLPKEITAEWEALNARLGQ